MIGNAMHPVGASVHSQSVILLWLLLGAVQVQYIRYICTGTLHWFSALMNLKFMMAAAKVSWRAPSWGDVRVLPLENQHSAPSRADRQGSVAPFTRNLVTEPQRAGAAPQCVSTDTALPHKIPTQRTRKHENNVFPSPIVLVQWIWDARFHTATCRAFKPSRNQLPLQLQHDHLRTKQTLPLSEVDCTESKNNIFAATLDSLIGLKQLPQTTCGCSFNCYTTPPLPGNECTGRISDSFQ